MDTPDRDESEERLNFIFEQVPDAIFLVDLQGVIVDGNKMCQEFTGYRKEEFIGKSFLELRILSPDDLARARERLVAAARGARPGLEEYTVVQRDGRRLAVELRSFGLRSEGRQLVLFVARDISERKRIELERAEFQKIITSVATEWRRVADAVPAVIVILDLDGRIVRMNQAARELLGGKFQDHLGAKVGTERRGQPWDYFAVVVDAIRARRNVGALNGPSRVQDEGDGKVWDITASLNSQAGCDDVVMAVARDVTDLATMEELVRRTEKMSATGTLFGGVAQEVRDPLFRASATLDALEGHCGADENVRRYIAPVRKELERIGEVMQRLVEFRRPDDLRATSGSLERILRSAIDACRPLATAAKVEIRRVGDEELPPVRMYAERLEKVFGNVLKNAIQHSAAGGAIEVDLRRVQRGNQGWIDCAIKDAGPGFQEDELPMIFEPFYSRHRGGTGLGLAFAQRIVTEHLGKISAENRPEGGGVVTICVPCLD